MTKPVCIPVLTLLVGLLTSSCTPSTTSDPATVDLAPDPDACGAAGMQQTCLCGSVMSGTQLCGANLRYGSCACPMGKRVFVTSATYTGNLMAQAGASDGLAGGDKLCQQAAQAAVLGGTWKAWLSAPGVDAKTRIADVGPWYLLDGKTKVFNNAAGLTTTPLAPITTTEQKVSVTAPSNVWTGTDNGGVISTGNHCTGWTAVTGGTGPLLGRVGDVYTVGSWTSGNTQPCGSSYRLYCFEQ